jgi:hypothetical protein
MDSLTELFCLIDDFCQGFEPEWEKRLLTDGQKKRRRPASLSLSELMTLAVLFHQLRYRQFKSFYLSYARRFLRTEFPGLPSYHRCLELMPRCAVPLSALFEQLRGVVPALLFSIPARLPCATTCASPGIGSLPRSLHEARVRLAGSTA